MWLPKRISLKLILKLSAVVASVGMLALLSQKTGWRGSSLFQHHRLAFTNADGNPEAACNCSAVLQGDEEEIEKSKILGLTKAFQEALQIPDEYYINATQDCRCGPT